MHAVAGCHELDEVTSNVRVVARLGILRFLVINAVGGVDPWLRLGTLCRITDHPNLTGKNPLIGPNFAESSRVFRTCRRPTRLSPWVLLEKAAERAWRGLVDAGVYVRLPWPSYETLAEIRMLRTLGAALVGMSTVHEVNGAVLLAGTKVAGLSCVTNHAACASAQPLDRRRGRGDRERGGAEAAGVGMQALSAMIAAEGRDFEPGRQRRAGCDCACGAGLRLRAAFEVPRGGCDRD